MEEVMHQYELMRLLARVTEMLARVAPEAIELRDEVARIAAEWNAEEREFYAAIEAGKC
jgi:hypothetical protein